MGIFAKLNFRAVDAAYKDVAALCFVTFLSIECKQDCQSCHDVVDLQHIAERVAEERAGDILAVSTTRRDADAALLRLGQVVRGLTKELKSEVGARPTVGDLLQILDKFFDLIAVKVLQSARRGYLNISLSDADYFVTNQRLTMIDSTTHFRVVSQIVQEVQTRASDKPVGGGAGFCEIDRRPKHREYAGIWDAYSKASIIREPVNMAPSEPSKPTASSDRHETTSPKQSMRHAFCAPVIIEGPSPAIGGEKLVEDVGLATSNADFITILDKFSWVPHSRTFHTQLPTPTPKRVTVTFARRESAFSPGCTTLGTFLLTGFSGKDEVASTLEIRVNAIDSGLTFEVRDAAGSNLAITRIRDDGNLRK